MVGHGYGYSLYEENGWDGGGEGGEGGGNNAKNSDLYIRGRWLNTFN